MKKVLPLLLLRGLKLSTRTATSVDANASTCCSLLLVGDLDTWFTGGQYDDNVDNELLISIGLSSSGNRFLWRKSLVSSGFISNG